MNAPQVLPYDPSLRQATLAFGATYGLGWGRDERIFDWKYERPLPPSAPQTEPRLWVAEDRGRVVGCFGVVPARLRFAEKRVDAVVPVDIHLLPEYRGRGHGQRLFDAAFESREAVLGMYGTPPSHGLMLRNGHREVSGLESLTNVRRSPGALWRLATARWRRGRGPLPPIARHAEELAALVPGCRPAQESEAEEIDRCLERCLDRYELAVERDWALLEWRYRDHPRSPGAVFSLRGPDENLSAVFVLARRRMRNLETLVLADLFMGEEGAAAGAAVVAALPAMARVVGADLTTMVTLSAELKALVGRADRRSPKTASVRLPRAWGTPPLKMDRWYISAGDSDYVAR